MAKKRKHKRAKATGRRGGNKSALSKSRGHIPVRVLEGFERKMRTNLPKLQRVIAYRKAHGE